MIDFDHRWHKVSDDVRDAIDIYTGQPVEFTGLNLPERGVRVHQGGVVDQKIRNAHGVEYVNCPIGYLNIVTDIHAGKAMGRRIPCCPCSAQAVQSLPWPMPQSP